MTTSVSDMLADGPESRAAIVGWVLLAAVVILAFLFVVVWMVVAAESLTQRVAQFQKKHPSFLWFVFFGALAFVAVGFIFSNFGVALIGGAALFCVWRVNEAM